VDNDVLEEDLQVGRSRVSV